MMFIELDAKNMRNELQGWKWALQKKLIKVVQVLKNNETFRTLIDPLIFWLICRKLTFPSESLLFNDFVRNQDVQMWQQAGLLVLCMIEEQGLGRCSPEEIVKLKRRRLSNLRHNFTQQQIYKSLPGNKMWL